MDVTLTAILLSWKWRLDVIALIGTCGAMYVVGWCRLRRRDPRGASGWRLGLYVAGLAALYLALLSPIDALGSLLFSVHMIQHELLTMVAPPLLLLGNPLPAVLWGLPRRWRRAAGILLLPDAWTRWVLRVLTLMPVAWLLYVSSLWLWHLPAVYGASLRSAVVHDVQHVSFFATALLFWWPIVDPAPRLHGHVNHAVRVVYVIPAAFQSQALGLIFAFLTGRILYPHYETVPRLWDFTPLQDQSAAGLIMMQVEGLIYLMVVLVLIARLFAREERLTRWREEHGLEP